MARTVRKPRFFTKSCRRCLAVVAVVCAIKLVTLLPIYLVVKHRFLNSIFGGDSVDSFTVSTGINVGNWKDITEFEWRPNLSKVQQVLTYLNMTVDEARENLPLTLDGDLLLSNESVCGGQGHPVDLLFLVHTIPVNFQRRLQMRGTIMREEHFLPHKVRVVFLLGQVANGSVQAALDYEHLLYRDTVQGQFLDSTRTLSHKGVLGFRWATRYCPQARYVVKMDDDVFFDTYKMLLRYRGIFEGQKRTIFCNVWVRDSMPVYRQDDKWALEERYFQGLQRFPFDYCSGLAVVLTGDLLPALYRAAFFTPVLWIDDIYLFGMLPWVAGDLTMMDLGYQSRYVATNTTEAMACMQEKQWQCSVLATVCYTTEDWETMWNLTYTLHFDRGWKVPYLRVN